MPFYAVARGRASGIFMSWGDCEAQVKGFSGARYKKFDSIQSAQDFINVEGSMQPPSNSKPSSTYTRVSKDFSYNNNLKRSYSTTSQSHQKSYDYGSGTSFDYEANTSKVFSTHGDSDFSDGSDDLNTVIMKQMDDIEKRVDNFGKGVEKIIKKSSTGQRSTGPKKTIMIEPPQPKKRRSTNSNFDTDSEGYVQVYTDGACSSNGKAGARAGIGVYWGEGHELNTSKPVSGRATNNCGEIQAATYAIKQALKNGVSHLTINTDSKFLINSATKWMPGWKRKGWKLQSGEPVKNEKDFKDLESVQKKLNVRWNYVEAHKGVHGNEMADQLAKTGAANYNR